MKKLFVLFLAVTFLFPAVSTASSDCREIYEAKLLRKEAWRARRSAAAVFVGAFAVSPLVTPLGAVTFGSFAVLLLGSGSGMHILNKQKIILPRAVKQYMIVDEVLNPNQSLHLEDYTNQILFGRKVGYKYDFLPEAKKQLFYTFITHLQKKAQRRGANYNQIQNVTEESVRNTISELMKKGNALCTNSRGKEKALMMFKFENIVLKNIL